MPRFCIEMAYDGSAFCGWQVQPTMPSVQQLMQDSLGMLLHEPIEVTGCGRTDTGVHTAYYVMHFDAMSPVDTEDLLLRLNRFLKSNVRIYSVQAVDSGFHARFDAVQREYRYYVALQKSPFFSQYSWFLPINADVDDLNRVSAVLYEYSDFTSFSKLHGNAKTNICHIKLAQWQQHDDILVFTIRADRFLRNMVRAVVGTLVEVAKGRVDEAGFRSIIEAKNRCESGQSVPAHGLFLTDVVYPENLFSRAPKQPVLPLGF